MKRILLMFCMLISLHTFSQEQFNVGISTGVTLGNIEPYSKIAFGAEVNYLFDVTDDFLLGPSLGLIYFSPKEIDGVKIDAPMFLPISASIYFNSVDERFYAGGELGYAVSLSEFSDNGGFFIKPTVGYRISDALKINAFYAGVKTSSPTYAYGGLGLIYDLKGSENSQYAY